MEAFDDEDLVSFINKEKQSLENLNIYRAYRHFCKCINKGACSIYSRFELIKDINMSEAVISGTNMMYYVFWILLSYSYNTKLTIFLTERAVLLFIEFIVMSRNTSNIDLNFIPNIKDAINFAYKKTIGVIVPNFNDNDELKAAKNAAYDITYILQECFLINVCQKNNFKDNLDRSNIDTYTQPVTNNINTLPRLDKSIDNNLFDADETDKINLQSLYKHIKYDLAVFSKDDIISNNLKTHFITIDAMIYFLSNTLYDFYSIFKKDNNNYAYHKILSIIKLNEEDEYSLKDTIFICKIIFESFFDIYERTCDYQKTSNIIDEAYTYFIGNNMYSSKLDTDYNINKKKGNYLKFRRIILTIL